MMRTMLTKKAYFYYGYCFMGNGSVVVPHSPRGGNIRRKGIRGPAAQSAAGPLLFFPRENF